VYYDRQDRIGGEGKLSFVSRIKYGNGRDHQASVQTTFGSALCWLPWGFLLTGVARVGSAASHSHSMEFGLIAPVSLMGSLPLLSASGFLAKYLGRVYDE